VAGILRGSGRQLLGAVVNFVCYYVVGLPLAIVLALVVHMGALGIWIGLAGGTYAPGIISMLTFCGSVCIVRCSLARIIVVCIQLRMRNATTTRL